LSSFRLSENSEEDFIAWPQFIEQQTILRLELLHRAAGANRAALRRFN
jgi:hypothetical protein